MNTLFIKNNNNCSAIAAYQFIKLSKLTYNQFKQMIKDLSNNELDMEVIKFLELIAKKYWKIKDFSKFPTVNNAKAFTNTNNLLKRKDISFDGISDDLV